MRRLLVPVHPSPPMTDPQSETTPGASSPGAPAVRHPPPAALVQVAAGGAIGAALRHALVLAFPPDPGRFPLTTFAENLAGSFLLGVLLTALLRRRGAGWDARPLLATGVLGSFTTFSAVSVELVQLGGGGRPGLALGYAAASALAGLGAAAMGIAAGRRLTPEAR